MRLRFLRTKCYGGIILCLSVISTASCTDYKEESDPHAEPLQFIVPDHFPSPVYSANKNPTTSAGFELGRRLFYDPILSRDSSISCGSCHAQVHAFADHNMRVSIGIDQQLGTRNSPAMFNLAWFPSFMWDGGINHIEVMPLGPLHNEIEMGENITNVVAKLNAHPYYLEMFHNAFESEEITDQQFLFALAQFMRMMISDGSKYDRVKQGRDAFNQEELKGYSLFQQNCANCHEEPLFSDFSFRNNGIDSIFQDQGRKHITGKPEDAGKFKVPSLRNLEFTYPYMHDGRFVSIDDVLDHYSKGILVSKTLDPSLKEGIQITNKERDALKSFLNTLNDYEFLGKKHLSEPRWRP